MSGEVFGGGASPISSTTFTAISTDSVLWVGFNISQTITSVVTNAGAVAMTNIPGNSIEAPGTSDCYGYYRENVDDAPTTIQWDLSADDLVVYFAYEIGGCLTSGALGQSNAAEGTASTNITVSFTTATNNEAAVGATWTNNSDTFTPQSGYTANPSSGSAFNFGVDDNDVGTAGAKTAGGTKGGNVDWGVIVASFKTAVIEQKIAWITA
jgi:hypothetical protein